MLQAAARSRGRGGVRGRRPWTRVLLAAVLGLLLAGPCWARGGEARPPRGGAASPEGATAWNAYWVGHSLLSRIPDAVGALVAASPGGLSLAWKEQNIPGASLEIHWSEALPDRQRYRFEPTWQQRYDLRLATGEVDTLVLTDSVPRGGQAQEEETHAGLVRFATLAREKNPAVRVLYYETWHCLDTGTPKGCEWDKASPTRNLAWVERVEADRAMWRRVVARANATLVERKVPGASAAEPVIRMLPAGPALAQAVREAEQGKLAGLKGMDDFFSDRIHANALGAYLVGCVHYAGLTGRSPVGLPSDIKERWGHGWWTPRLSWTREAPPAAVIRRLQELAWEAVRSEPGLLGPAARRK